MRPNLSWPGPLTLLSTARSPSRCGYRTPLVGSYPTVSPITPHKLRSWSALCCGCSQSRFSALCPHLLFREAILRRQIVDAESREVPLPDRNRSGSDGPGYTQKINVKGHPLTTSANRRPRQDSNLRPFGPQPNALIH